MDCSIINPEGLKPILKPSTNVSTLKKSSWRKAKGENIFQGFPAHDE